MNDQVRPDPTRDQPAADAQGETCPEAFGPLRLREPDAATLPPSAPPQSSATRPPEPPTGATNHLELLEEIAQGGMGAVFRGRDTDLRRDLAVKVLLQEHAAKNDLLERFLEEAQIAGQLQHPGVVPVHELGQLPDQRPYFTMKLVKGRTLAELLAERSEPSQDRPRFLKIFEQVCQTLAYAHARHVIHRDLKPANIMVGAYGEVLVMDWGLAKLLHEGGSGGDAARPQRSQQAVSVIQTRRSDGVAEFGPVTQTQAGSVLGTLAYMAPEQARGAVDRVDARADVFGLGAILCEILTGRPPYVAADPQQVYCLAVMADLAQAFARLDGCAADAELIALAKRCLAAEPGDRPGDGGAVAAELTAYLESVERRLRHAEVERGQAQVKVEEERKRRGLAIRLAAAVAVVAVIAGVACVAALIAHQKARQSQHETASALATVESQKQEVEGSLSKAEAAERVARAEEEKSRQLLYTTDMRLAPFVWKDDRSTAEQLRILLARHIPDPAETGDRRSPHPAVRRRQARPARL